MSEIIFDSRRGADVYYDDMYYRSSNFTVLENESAVLELTTHQDFYVQVEFMVIRIVGGSVDDCYPTDGLEKPYRLIDGEPVNQFNQQCIIHCNKVKRIIFEPVYQFNRK